MVLSRGIRDQDVRTLWLYEVTGMRQDARGLNNGLSQRKTLPGVYNLRSQHNKSTDLLFSQMNEYKEANGLQLLYCFSPSAF